MKTVLVAIPTNGKRNDIFNVIEYTSKSLKELNVKPAFSICADDTTGFNSRQLDNTVVCSLNPEKFDYTHHVAEAIKQGIAKFNPDFVSTIADDFVFPAKQFSKLIEPLLNGYDAAFGCWGSNEIASTYPKFQYVSELFVNRITNTSSKQATPDYKNMLSYSFDYNFDFSDMIQIFSGISAFTKESWNNTLNEMFKIFGTTKLGWSLEVISLLVLKELKSNVKNVECERVKESNPPNLGEATTRIIQIKNAFDCTNTFLKHTKQYEKLEKFLRIEEEMIKIVEDLLVKSSS